GTARYIADYGYFQVPNYGFRVYLDDDTDRMYIYLRNTDGDFGNTVITVTPDTWVLVGFTWDGANFK
ncbi:unnamed protein product, partial [marine sediment metagenome]